MPTAYIKKLAEEGKGTIAQLERKWDEAKAKAEAAGQGDNFAYITSIFQSLAHISASTSGLEFNPTQIIGGENAYHQSLIETGQFTEEQVHEAWEKAKRIASDNAEENPNIVPSYAYTTSIFQSLLGIKEQAMVRAASRLIAASKL
jgi:hypothetical protein